MTMITPAAEPRGRVTLWTRDYALALLSMHLFYLGWTSLFGALPSYLGAAPKWQIGWVVGGAFGIASLVMRPWSGRLVDRDGRRRWMIRGAVLVAVGVAAHAISPDPLLLTAVRLVYGVGSALYTTAAMAMLADLLPADRRGVGMAWYGVVYTATNVYGPWLGLSVATTAGYRPFFLLVGLLLLGCAGAAVLLKEPRSALAAANRSPRWLSGAALLPTSVFLPLTLAYSALPAFLALYAVQRALGNAGAFFAVMGLVLMLSRWLGGGAADRFGRAAVIAPGCLLGAAGMGLLALAGDPLTFYLAAAVFGAGFGLGHTGLTVLTMDRAAPAERGAAMATFVLAWDVGTLGVFLLGFVADAVNLRALLPLGALAIYAVGLRYARAPAPVP